MNSNRMFKMDDNVSLVVIIDGQFVGTAQGSLSLELTIEKYVEDNCVEDFNEQWILDYVETYPVLTANPLPLTYDVTRDLDIEFNEGNNDEETYYVEDIDSHFGDLEELEDWIRESINDFEYTESQVNSWTIEKRVVTKIEVDVSGEDDYSITAYGTRKKISEFIETSDSFDDNFDLDGDDLDLSENEFEIVDDEDEEEIEVVKEFDWDDFIDEDDEEPKVPEDLMHRSDAYFLHSDAAIQHFYDGKKTYLFNDGDAMGKLATSGEVLRRHVTRGGSAARAWGDK